MSKYLKCIIILLISNSFIPIASAINIVIDQYPIEPTMKGNDDFWGNIRQISIPLENNKKDGKSDVTEVLVKAVTYESNIYFHFRWIDNSNDNQNYEFKKQQEEKKESGGPAGMGSQPETSGGGSGGGSADKKEKIVCTEMYRQTQLDDWQRTIKLWYLFQKKYLSKTHQKGYHFLFKPFVKGMQKSNMLTSIGRHFAQERTKDIKHIMYGTKFSLLGRVYRIILEPICFVVGLLLWQKK